MPHLMSFLCAHTAMRNFGIYSIRLKYIFSCKSDGPNIEKIVADFKKNQETEAYCGVGNIFSRREATYSNLNHVVEVVRCSYRSFHGHALHHTYVNVEKKFLVRHHRGKNKNIIFCIC